MCEATEWFYVRFERSGDALEVIMDFFKRTSPVAIAYLELFMYG
jgi:hypothetical protein